MSAEKKEDIIEPVDFDSAQIDEIETAKPKYAANTQMDDAAKLLADAGGHVEYTNEDSKRVRRKIDLYVCLPMCLVYFIQQLDKSSISYAAVFNLQAETNLQGSEYSWLSSIVYIAQLIVQPLSVYALIVFPVKYWIVFNMAAWSIVTMCMSAAHNFAGLVTARFFLGVFEGTVAPGFILITQMWWLRREQSYRAIAYQIANSCASLFGPLLAYAIGQATKSSTVILPHQGIFLFLGAISFVIVPLIFWMLPNSPTTARFLRSGNDRLIAIDRLKENNTGTKASKFKWSQAREAFCDIKTYMWAGMWLCGAIPSGGFFAFGGLITKGFGFDTFTTIIMQMPTGGIGIVSQLIGIYFTNRYKKRWPVVAIALIFPIAGAAALVKVPRDNTAGLMASYYIAFLFTGVQPLLVSWCNLNAAGTTKRVVTTSVMFGALTIGNVIGPQMYFQREKPYYRTGLYVNLGCWSVELLLAVAMGFHLRRLNRKQEARRVALGLPANLKDTTIMTLEEADAYRIELEQTLARAGMSIDALTQHSFDDMTDFENPMFQYVV